ncbi:uncharacterized protein LOC133911203 [Phragmites australis]|uniref:uncharacterized protein LOC133911203 n=1 Tax=Phragmites australis TaxID=29695 RepID=UPI002D77EC87|nr:uncharacterized protein LOC133911203 [Phragmites australis]
MGSLGGGRRTISGPVIFISVVLLSAAIANGIRTGVVGAPSPAVTTTQAAGEITSPPVGTSATTAPSAQQAPPLDDRYRDSKRKVPNGPDPIHNRRARWGEAPARRV